MSWKLARTPFIALCALLLLGSSAGVLGCSAPWASTTPSTDAPTAVVNQAIYQLQAALGLPDGAITRSSQPPILAGSDVALRWSGGRADVDLKNGRIRAILIDRAEAVEPGSETTTTVAPTTTSKSVPPSTTTTTVKSKKKKPTTTTTATTTTAAPTTTTAAPTTTSTTTLPDVELDDEAGRILGLLGWDGAALKTAGFTPNDSRVVDHGVAGKVYEKSWTGHDSEGVLNEGIIEVGLDAMTGDLRSFLYTPGPQVALDMTKAITKAAAVIAAREAAAKSSLDRAATSDTSSEDTTLTTTAKTSGSGTATSTTLGTQVESAALVHTDNPGITGGEEMLVWIVKLSMDSSAGRVTATVYIDAVSGTALEVIAT